MLGILAAPIVGFQAFNRWSDRQVDTEVLDGVAGFRKVPGGPVSSPQTGWLAGIEDGTTQRITPLPAVDLCDALYVPSTSDRVQVAIFSDYFCPHCRVLSRQLDERDGDSVQVTWHELPLLNESSEPAARVALAAELQDSYLPMHKRLMRASFQNNASYVSRLSDGLGLDSPRIIADSTGARVSQRLLRSQRAAATLGIVATPGMVIGRTVVVGAVSETRLDALIDAAARNGEKCP